MPGPPGPRDLPGALDAPGRPRDSVVLAAGRAESPAAGRIATGLADLARHLTTAEVLSAVAPAGR